MAKTVLRRQTINAQTGEMMEVEVYKIQTDNAAQFARVFFQDINSLAQTTGAEKGVVLVCLQYLEYNTNEFILTPDRREAVCRNAGIQPQTATAAISNLRKKNIIIKKRGSLYILNPNILFYGEEKERKKVIAANAEHILGGGVHKATKKIHGKK